MSGKALKVLTVGCLSAGLLLNPLAAAAQLQVGISQPAQQQHHMPAVKITLEQAIEAVKEAFNIGSEYDRFESSLNTYNGQMVWWLSWRKSSEPAKSINVGVNAASGKIVSMDYWQAPPPGQKHYGLPQYSYDEAQKFAQTWAKKLAGDYYAQTKLIPNEEPPIIPLGERGPAEYHYTFARTVNGITFPQNNISIRIDGDSGKLLSYNLTWDDKLKFPSPANKISAQRAEQILKENVELTYFQPQVYTDEKQPIKLVYRVKKGSGLYIDALGGKVIEDSDYDYLRNEAAGSGDLVQVKELSPQEQAEIDNIKDVLSAEKALAKLKETVSIPEALSLQESRLHKHYFSEQKIWSFYWSGERGSMNAQVDAKSGELLSFSKWLNDSGKGEKQKHTLDAARQIAENFIKKLQPARYQEVRLENKDLYRQPLKELNTCSFNFVRLVNGIPFTNNGFNVTVDLNSGEVTAYSMNWWGDRFPDPSGVMGINKATSIFTSDKGLALEYITLRGKEQEEIIYLAYHLKNRPSYIIDAKSGTFLNWRGEPIAPKQSTKFSDIAGHPAEEDIKMLAAANIITGTEGKFNPSQQIRKIDLLTWLVKSRGYHLETPDEKKIVDAALQLGIIDANDTGNLHKELTRLDVAKLMINYLDYDGVAKLNNLFNFNVQDAAAVPADLRGYAAISVALGLQNTAQGYYHPNNPVTRADAATAVVKLLNVQK